MKTLSIFLSLIILTTAVPAFAKECDAGEQVNVKVNGMVCDFCARALEKVFGREDAVNNINVDLDTGIVGVALKPGQNMDDEKLKTLILDSGYNVAEIKRECKA